MVEIPQRIGGRIFLSVLDPRVQDHRGLARWLAATWDGDEQGLHTELRKLSLTATAESFLATFLESRAEGYWLDGSYSSFGAQPPLFVLAAEGLPVESGI